MIKTELIRDNLNTCISWAAGSSSSLCVDRDGVQRAGSLVIWGAVGGVWRATDGEFVCREVSTEILIVGEAVTKFCCRAPRLRSAHQTPSDYAVMHGEYGPSIEGGMAAAMQGGSLARMLADSAKMQDCISSSCSADDFASGGDE